MNFDLSKAPLYKEINFKGLRCVQAYRFTNVKECGEHFAIILAHDDSLDNHVLEISVDDLQEHFNPVTIFQGGYVAQSEDGIATIYTDSEFVKTYNKLTLQNSYISDGHTKKLRLFEMVEGIRTYYNQNHLKEYADGGRDFEKLIDSLLSTIAN